MVLVIGIDQSSSAVIESGLYYVAVRTNVKSVFSISVTAGLLETTNGYFMGYNLYTGEKTKTAVTGPLTGTPLVISESAETLSLTLSEGTAEKGMRTINFPFQVTITSAQYVAAVVGDYTANITFTLTAN